MSTAPAVEPLSIGDVAQRILIVRGQRVLLDADLARFYGETTKRLNQQVRRNRERFPEDFMFELTAEEFADLRLQSATSSAGHGARRWPSPSTGRSWPQWCSTASAPRP